jgi:hypothetical protein
MPATKLLKGIPSWTFEKRRDPSFNFVSDPHEYHMKGQRLWSPSGTFLQIRYVDDRYYTEESRYRGQYVHRATHLIDEQDIVWNDIAPEYLAYIEAYCEFKEVWRFKPRMREIPIYHPDYSYGVTPDGEGIILDGDAAIVELKTGTMPWWTAIQTAAQEMAVAAWDNPKNFRRRFGVELKKNGKFRVKEFDDDHDYAVWEGNLITVQRTGQPRVKLTEALAY